MSGFRVVEPCLTPDTSHLTPSLHHRPSVMPEGNPVSQPFGEFHGRADILSGSVVAQPHIAKPAKASRSRTIRVNLSETNFTMREWRQ